MKEKEVMNISKLDKAIKNFLEKKKLTKFTMKKSGMNVRNVKNFIKLLPKKKY